MQLIVNGQERRCDPGSLAELWRAEAAPLGAAGRQGFAIAVNGHVVRRDEWDATALREGDSVEIIRAVQGG